MTLAEGVEAKELRGALEAIGSCLPPTIMSDDVQLDMVDVDIARASEVLARPKSSYEQEVVLMEKVVSVAKRIYTLRASGASRKAISGAILELVTTVVKLDKFREKKPTPSTSQGERG